MKLDRPDKKEAEEWRRIIHIDMDCFYAAVEERDNPSLRGKPVAVGHAVPRGVVATANYVARKFGVHSALPVKRAKKLCPSLLIVPPRFDVYKKVSSQIHEIFREYTDIIEPLSLDEAYLDVTCNKAGLPFGVDVARQIKQKIKERLHLTASAGVSFNKFLAKIASDWRKPDGLCVIHPARALDFIKRVPIEDFWGVGQVNAKKMHELGVTDGASLAELSLETLTRYFGKSGRTFYNFARGIDNRRVETERIRKTVSCETTFGTDIVSKDEMVKVIEELALDLQQRISKHDFSGNTFVLKVKYANFRTHTRSHTYGAPLRHSEEFVAAAIPLLYAAIPDGQPVRLLGIGVADNSLRSSVEPVFIQPTIPFDDLEL